MIRDDRWFIYVKKMYDVGILMQDLPIEQWIPRAILPIGFALLGLRFVQVLLRLLSRSGRIASCSPTRRRTR